MTWKKEYGSMFRWRLLEKMKKTRQVLVETIGSHSMKKKRSETLNACDVTYFISYECKK
jgi:hypothetical protein